MNLFAKTGRESYKPQQTAEPYVARRAVRYAAADNAQAALQRQFPGMSFVTQQAVSQSATTAILFAKKLKSVENYLGRLLLAGAVSFFVWTKILGYGMKNGWMSRGCAIQ